MSVETFDVDDLTLWQDERDGQGQPGQGQPGQGQPGQGQPGQGQPGQGQPGQGQPGQGEGKDGKGKPQPGKGITREDVEGKLNKHTDDHKPGSDEGKKTDIKTVSNGRPLNKGDIDQNHKRINDDMKKSSENEDTKNQPRKKWEPSEAEAADRQQSSGGDEPVDGIDYTKVRPSITWKQLIKKFVMSAAPKTDESWRRPHRRSAGSLTTAKQTGAGAIKPAVLPAEAEDLKLAIGIDTSGSMMATIPKVYAEVNALMKRTEFKNKKIYVFKFGTTYEIYECYISKNEAYRVSLTDKKRLDNAKTTCTAVFGSGLGGGTEITEAGANELAVLLGQGYNVVFITDSDMSWSGNLKIMKQLLLKGQRRMFLLLRSRSEYIAFRKNAGFETNQMSYINEE